MIQWPGSLVKDIARRRAVVVVGSGISRNSQNSTGERPKTWRMLLDRLAGEITPNQHIRQLLNMGDYLTACDVIKRNMKDHQFKGILREEFIDPRFQPSPFHEEIFKLDARIVATPNFDKIYDTFANQQSGSSTIIKNHYDHDVAEIIRTTNRIILKIHGTIDSPDRLIFTREEYAEARQQYRNFYRLLESLAVTNTFIFLGCGIADPDIQLLMEDTCYRHRASPPHYFILPGRSVHKDVQRTYEGTMNLEFVTYPSSKGNHQALLHGLRDLVRRVEEEREAIKTTMNW